MVDLLSSTGNQSDKAIAIFANAIQAYSRMMRLNPEEFKKHIKGFDPIGHESFGDWYITRADIILNELSQFINFAADNQKEMVLGYLGVNESAINIVNALVINGQSMEEIVQFLKSYEIQKVFKGVSKSKGMTEDIRKNVYDEAVNYIENIRSLLAETSITSKIKEEYNQIKEILEPRHTFSKAQLDNLHERMHKLGVLNIDENEAITLAENVPANSDFENEYVQTFQSRLDNLEKLKKYYCLGQFVTNLSFIMGIYNGEDVKDFEREMTLNNIEGFLGISLDRYFNGDSLYDENGDLIEAKFMERMNKIYEGMKADKAKQKIDRTREVFKVGNLGAIIRNVRNIYEYIRTMHTDMKESAKYHVMDRINKSVESIYLASNKKKIWFDSETDKFYSLQKQPTVG